VILTTQRIRRRHSCDAIKPQQSIISHKGHVFSSWQEVKIEKPIFYFPLFFVGGNGDLLRSYQWIPVHGYSFS